VRDDFRCVWCGEQPPKDELTLDHLFSRGHRCRDNAPRRLVTACVTCNVSRKHLRLAEWLRRLRREGVDLGPVLRRLAIARHLPPNRRAGDRALAAYRAELAAPPPTPPLSVVDPWDESQDIPF